MVDKLTQLQNLKQAQIHLQFSLQEKQELSLSLERDMQDLIQDRNKLITNRVTQLETQMSELDKARLNHAEEISKLRAEIRERNMAEMDGAVTKSPDFVANNQQGLAVRSIPDLGELASLTRKELAEFRVARVRWSDFGEVINLGLDFNNGWEGSGGPSKLYNKYDLTEEVRRIEKCLPSAKTLSTGSDFTTRRAS